MSTKLREMREGLQAKRDALFALYEQGGGLDNLDLSKITDIKGDDNAKLAELRKRDSELARDAKAIEDLAALERSQKQSQADDAARENAERSGKTAPAPVVGFPNVAAEVIKRKSEVLSAGIKAVLPGDPRSLKVEHTTDGANAAGLVPESTRIPGLLVADAHQEPTMFDVIPTFMTNQHQVVYLEEDGYDNNAIERNENAAYVASAFHLTEKTADIRSVGHLVTATDEMLEDVEFFEGYLRSRLYMGIREVVSQRILTGTGTKPQLAGLFGVTGYTTKAKGGNVPGIDEIRKGVTSIATGAFANADLVVLHPTAWEAVRLTKAATTGIYLFGPPSERGASTLWGLRVLQTTEVDAAKAYVAAMSQAALFVRREIMLEAGRLANDFENGRVSIRAGMRAAVVRFRPAAFYEITAFAA